ncbi:T9SS type A sorting domain-containing protein [Rapidithrix thailandica]|uniref:T9SS type A sorting domain-containing protein n=1 Tax=Rapidithrix thailandica TaxID=413964 RepID=A0AAW9SJ52_9BACT
MYKLAAYFLHFFVFVFCFNFYHSVTAQHWEEVAKVLPQPHENYNVDTEFGSAIAVDGTTAVVGAPKHNRGGSYEKGVAYIFEYNNDTWKKVARLTASGDAARDYFGYDVAISGNTVAISKRDMVCIFTRPDEGWTDMTETARIPLSGGFDLSNSGNTLLTGTEEHCEIYVKPESGWISTDTPTAYLRNSAQSFFRRSVAIDDNTAIASGKNNTVYVYEMPEGGWRDMTETAVLTPSEVSSNSFGVSLAIEGETILAGASYDVIAGEARGIIYLFSEPESGWTDMTETARLYASDGIRYDRFGSTLALASDLVVVGVQGRDNKAGQVYVFSKPVTGWTTSTETKRLKASNSTPTEMFGRRVSTNGEAVMVGIFERSKTGEKVYMYTAEDNNWRKAVTEVILLPPHEVYYSNLYDRFGTSVAMDQNIAVVGAPGHYKNPFKRQLYVYEFVQKTWHLKAKLSPSEPDSAQAFGTSVAIEGGIILTGGSDKEGRLVYLFEKPEQGWMDMHETVRLYPSDPTEESEFGETLAISEETIIVGDKAYLSGQGAVYVYEMPEGGWMDMTETVKLTASNGRTKDAFGTSLAIEHQTMVIGARGFLGDNPSDVLSSIVYIFERNLAEWPYWSEQKMIHVDAGETVFGVSVAISGTTIAIGAPGVSLYGDNHHYPTCESCGAIYIYERPAAGWGESVRTKALYPSGSGTLLGISLVLDDEKLVAGARYDEFNGEGAFYHFQKPEEGWEKARGQSYHLPSDSEEFVLDAFGYSIAMSGDNVLVGAPAKDGDFIGSGAAYFFKPKPAEVSYALSDAHSYNRAGKTIPIKLIFTQNVKLQNPEGPPRLLLETGETLRYAEYKESRGKVLTFEYTVQAGDYAEWLDYHSEHALEITNNASLLSENGLPVKLTLPDPGSGHSLVAYKEILVDAVPPEFVSVMQQGDDYYKPGEVLVLNVDMNEPGLVLAADLSGLDKDLNRTSLFTGLEDGTYELVSAPLDANGNMQEGTYRIPIRAGDVTGNIVYDSSLVVVADKTRPMIQLYPPEEKIITHAPFLVYVHFSEPVFGLEATDFTVQNGLAGQLEGSGQRFQVWITPQTGGRVQVQLPSNVVQDRAGIYNWESNLVEVLYQRGSDELGTSTFANAPKVYPNPAIQSLHIGITEAQALPASIKVYHINGKLAWEGILTGRQSTIPVHQLTKGVYFLQITNGQDAVVQRFVK